MAIIEDFEKLDIRIGEILRVETFPKARKPAYKMWIDFGEEIGVKRTSAQITDLYMPDDLVGKQILAITNFPVRQIADFISEVRILGAETDKGVVLVHPAYHVDKGSIIM